MPMLTYREALHHALREEMKRDERVLIFGEDVVAYGGAYGGTSGLAKDFGGKRGFHAPIAEGVIAGAAVGGAGDADIAAPESRRRGRVFPPLPARKFAAPAAPADGKGLLNSAIRDDD